MKTLGLIGGLSWFSTAVYYATINRLVNEQLGGLHSARILLYSVDFCDIKTLQEADDWPQIETTLSGIARKLEKAGAEAIVICSNTPHIVADTIRPKIGIPLLHIAEATAEEIVKQKIEKVGLLGTRFTMENPFFKDRLAVHGIETIIPGRREMEFVHDAIFKEFTKGVFKDETRKRYREIMENMQHDGARGIVFGCTEISLLLKPEECDFPVFDTAAIHCRAAVEFALQ